MVYQDLIRVRTADKTVTTYCAFRVGGLRHKRTITYNNLNQVGHEPFLTTPANHEGNLTQRLTMRAICIHSFMSANQGRRKESVALGAEELPEYTTIGTNNTGAHKEMEEEKGTPESVSLTPSGSEGTPGKQLDAMGMFLDRIQSVNKENFARIL